MKKLLQLNETAVFMDIDKMVERKQQVKEFIIKNNPAWVVNDRTENIKLALDNLAVNYETSQSLPTEISQSELAINGVYQKRSNIFGDLQRDLVILAGLTTLGLGATFLKKLPAMLQKRS